MTIKMKESEYYTRTDRLGHNDPVGPVFKVESVGESGAKLRATTTLTGWVLTVTTKEIPDGWTGPLDQHQHLQQVGKQIRLGGRRS